MAVQCPIPRQRRPVVLVPTIAAAILASVAWLPARQLPDEPPRQFGSGITGSMEGWFDNADGSHSFLIGYLNRNRSQEIDVPIGPNNHIDPGGPDMGQPTHFLPGRQAGVFTVPVPKDFKPTDSFVWEITANGQTTKIPLRTHADYVMSPFKEIAVGNTPPVLRFEQGGKTTQGPIATLASALDRTATVGTPLAL